MKFRCQLYQPLVTTGESVCFLCGHHVFVVLMASQMVCLAAKSFSWKIKIILTDADMLTCPGPAVLCFALAGIFSSAVKRSIGSTIGFHNHGEGPY